MSKNTTIVVIIAIALIIGIGALVATRPKATPSNSTTTTIATPSTSSTPTTTPATASTTVKFDGNGFSPAMATVKSGSQITFENDSNQTIQVESDPHPTHTDNPQLNIGTIAPGASKSATLTTTGNWGYHDHLDPSLTGRVTVQ